METQNLPSKPRRIVKTSYKRFSTRGQWFWWFVFRYEQVGTEEAAIAAMWYYLLWLEFGVGTDE